MGALSSIPQGIMQGVQQVSQLAGGMGGGESASLGQDELNKPDESLTHPKEEPSKSSSTQDGAGPAREQERRRSVRREWYEALELAAGLVAAQAVDGAYPDRRVSDAVALHRRDQRRGERLYVSVRDYQDVHAALGLQHLVFDDAWIRAEYVPKGAGGHGM